MVDYGNTKTASMHHRLGSATLSQLAFLRESNQNFPWEKTQTGNTHTVVKKKKKKRRERETLLNNLPQSGRKKL